MSAFGNGAVPAVGGVSADTVAQLISQFAIDAAASAGLTVAITAGNTTDGLGNVVAVAGASFAIPAGTSRYICVTPLNVLVMEAAVTPGNLALWQFTAGATAITTTVDLRYNFSGIPTVAAFLTVNGMSYFTLPITTAAAAAQASAAAAAISEANAAADAASTAADAIATAADAVSTAADAAAASGSAIAAAASEAAALGSKNVAVTFAGNASASAALATTKANEASASAASALSSKNTATTMASTATTMATSAIAASTASNAAKVLAEAAAAAAQASATSADASAVLASAVAMGDVTAALAAAPVKPSPDAADRLMLLDSSAGYTLKAATYAALMNTVTLTGLTTMSGGADVTDTTQSTSSTTGSLIVRGGLGVVKRINVGENLTARYVTVNNAIGQAGADLHQLGLSASESYVIASGPDNATAGTYSIRLASANFSILVTPFAVTTAGVTMTGTTQVAALTASGLVTLNANVVMGGAAPTITTDTADGADNKRLLITGGGAIGVGRGAYISLHGEEYAGGGDAIISSGTSGEVTLAVAGAAKLLATATGVDITGAISATGGVGSGVFFDVQTSTGYGFYQSAGNTLNFNNGHNGESAGWINYYGYAGGATQFRDLTIGDGKTGIVASFKGSTKAVTFNGAISAATSILSSGATSGIGYTTGAGGTVTQLTSKATGVTLNKINGSITLNNAALAAGAVISFTFTNSAIGADDSVQLNISGGTPSAYLAHATGNTSGSREIVLRNLSAGSLSEAIVLKFVVVKGANA